MGQVHGEEGYALRFHPARSHSLRFVSPTCTWRGHNGSLLVEEEEEAIDENILRKE